MQFVDRHAADFAGTLPEQNYRLECGDGPWPGVVELSARHRVRISDREYAAFAFALAVRLLGADIGLLSSNAASTAQPYILSSTLAGPVG